MKYRCEIRKDERGRAIPSLVKKGEVVSKLAVWQMPMRIGGAKTLMGGIGGVWTHEKHRNRGYASIVMEDACAWMRENDYDFSVLFGIPDFYHRWGFITTLSSGRVILETRTAEKAEPTCRVRAYHAADLPRAIRMYNDNNRSRTASIVRDETWTPWRKGLRWGVPPKLFSYTRAGKLAAVAAFDLAPDSVNCVDLSVADAGAFAGVVRHAAELAVERRVEKITFFRPPDGPFADFCRELGGCEITGTTPRCAGGMARIINQAQLFQKIAPELTRRLRASRLTVWSLSLDILTDLGATRLVVTTGRVAVGERTARRAKVTLRLPQDRLTQLLFGFQSIDFLLAHGFAKLSGNGRDVLNALFPRGTPYMAVPDHF